MPRGSSRGAPQRLNVVARHVSEQLLDEQHDDESAEQGVAHLEAGQLLRVEGHVGGVVHLIVDAGELSREVGRWREREVAFADRAR